MADSTRVVVRVRRGSDYEPSSFFDLVKSQLAPKRMPPDERWVPAEAFDRYDKALGELRAAEEALDVYWKGKR